MGSWEYAEAVKEEPSVENLKAYEKYLYESDLTDKEKRLLKQKNDIYLIMCARVCLLNYRSNGFSGGFFTGFSKKKAYNGMFNAAAIFLKKDILIVVSTFVASIFEIIEALVPDNSANFSWLTLP